MDSCEILPWYDYKHVRVHTIVQSSYQARIQDFGKGGGRVWVINWQCAHRRCVPLGGLKACPLGTFEILDAFSCNLVHILSKNYI